MQTLDGDDGRIESKHDVLLRSLRKFYADPAHLRALTDVLVGESRISLRILDWLVTNYSKKKNIVTVVHDADGVPTGFNMFLSYKAQLKSFSKKFFDPFNRRTRLTWTDADGNPFETTPGQLNFFRWALTNGVVDYGTRHAQDIEDDMMASTRHRQHEGGGGGAGAGAGAVGGGAGGRAAAACGKPKRKELSNAAIKTATKTFVKVTVRFS